MFKYLFLFVCAVSFVDVMAGFDNQQLSFMLGSVTTSYKEAASNLTVEDPEDVVPPASGSASSLPLDFSWEYYTSPTKSYFLRGTVPLIATSSDRYFSAGGGMNFYFKSISSKANYRDALVELKFVPQWRYFWGLDIGAGYLVYSTSDQKKADPQPALGGHVGVIYSINQDWGAKIEAGYTMSTGIGVSSNNIKVLLGTTYYLKN